MSVLLAVGAGKTALSLPLITWMLIAGVIIAWIIIFCNKRIVGALVRAIIDANATSEEAAKTLAELGQDDNVSAISRYKSSEALRRIIRTVGQPEEQGDSKKKKSAVTVDENTRFYIPEESFLRAKKQYGSDDSALTVILGTIAMIAVGIIVTVFIAK